jgi:uncharacterized protein (DUF58 family)
MEPDPRIIPTLDSLIRLQHEARGFSFLHKQPVTSLLAGRRASRIRGRGLAFEEIRAYRPGDDVRMIDWRASARTGRVQTRVFTEERDRPTLLVVNLTTGTFFGSIHATKTAVIAQVAALAAWRGLQTGNRIGAILFGDDEVEEHRPHRSRGAVMRILGAIARRAEALISAPAQPIRTGPLNDALRAAEALVSHDWLVLVVSTCRRRTRRAARSSAAWRSTMTSWRSPSPIRLSASCRPPPGEASPPMARASECWIPRAMGSGRG